MSPVEKKRQTSPTTMSAPRIADSTVCFICKRPDDDELLFGKFISKWRIRIHHHCLFLTSNLVQNGDSDSEGMFGFLLHDIREEEARIRGQKCYICKERYANISCCAKKCFRTFHAVCGIRGACLSHFCDTYQSWCDKHVELTDAKPHEETDACGICYEELGPYNKLESIHAPCCRNGWFHRRCVAQFALTAGYFFKCPLCNNKDTFTTEVQRRGVFVPEKDAAWELEPNAFDDQLERPSVCDAEECKCRFGRDFDSSKWDLILCATCGSTCRHDQCMEVPSKNYVCNFCRPFIGDKPPDAVLELAEAARRAEEERRQRGEVSSSSDEGDSHSDDSDSERNCNGYRSSTSGSRGVKDRKNRRVRNRSSSCESDRSFASASTSSSGSVLRKPANKKRKLTGKEFLLDSSDSEGSESELVDFLRRKYDAPPAVGGKFVFDVKKYARRLELSEAEFEKLIYCTPIVALPKMTAEEIQCFFRNGSSELAPHPGQKSQRQKNRHSTDSSESYDFNHRAQLNKARHRRTIGAVGLTSASKLLGKQIRSDTDSLTDVSTAEIASAGDDVRSKTPPPPRSQHSSVANGFAKHFKLKLAGIKASASASNGPSRKRIISSSESEMDSDCSAAVALQASCRSRVSLFSTTAENTENACPNSPQKLSSSTEGEDELSGPQPSPIKLKPLHVSLRAPSATPVRTAFQQTSLASFFKISPTAAESASMTADEGKIGHGGGHGGAANAAIGLRTSGSCLSGEGVPEVKKYTPKATLKVAPKSAPQSSRKKSIHLDHGQRKLFDYFNRC